MSDNYQAIYDAVCSRIGYCDVASIIRDVVCLPSVIYRPRVSIDGNQWCALYGDNIQDGVAGFGDSPALAMIDFDRAWFAKLKEAHP